VAPHQHKLTCFQLRLNASDAIATGVAFSARGKPPLGGVPKGTVAKYPHALAGARSLGPHRPHRNTTAVVFRAGWH